MKGIDTDAMVLLVVVISLLYFLPTLIAIIRGIRVNRRWGIFVFNLLLGCTGIGWIVALVWSISENKRINIQTGK